MFIFKFWLTSMLRIGNADPDPGQPNECGSMRIRIRNSNLPVLRIHDILVWIRIRIRGSKSLINGSGSCYFQDANNN
jgi:hypothetical protein